MEDDKDRLAMAEKILGEMIEAEAQGSENYELFVKHFDEENLKDFGPTRFKKEMMCIREDLGDYVSREYLGSLNGHIDPDNPDRYPEHVRYNWRGIFEKNETLITLGLYKKDGKFLVKEIMYR